MENEIRELCEKSDFVIPKKALDFLLLLVRGNYLNENCFFDDLKDTHKTCFKTVVFGCYVASVLQKYICEDTSKTFLKSDNTPVTLADLCVQIVMIQVLRECLSPLQIHVIAEEDFKSFHHHEIEQAISILNDILPLSLVQRILSPLRHKSMCETWTSDFVLTQVNSACESSTKIDLEASTDQQVHPYYYIMDPIDGTKGFLRKAQFSIGLGVMDQRTGSCVASFIACPNIEGLKTVGTLPNEPCLYYAVKHRGAKRFHLTTTSTVAPQVLKLSSTIPNSLAFLASANALGENEKSIQQVYLQLQLLKPFNILRLDSMTKYCLIAEGHGNIFLRYIAPNFQECVWDILPGALLIEEAGGYISHLDGTSLSLSCLPYSTKLLNSTGLLITGEGGKEFHVKLLKCVQNVCLV